MAVLVTGSTGFLGRELYSLLNKKGYEVRGLSRTSQEYTVDLSAEVPDFNEEFEYIIHCSGLAHQIHPKDNVTRFEEVNVTGTVNLLQGLEGQPLRALIFISTVAVYGVEKGEMISEEKSPNPTSAYSCSKLAAEEVVRSWCADRNIPLLILRLPLITGTNPPGNLAAMYNGIKNCYYFGIGKNSARKSMVAAWDIARWLPGVMGREGVFNLTDGVHPGIRDVEKKMAEISGRRIKTLPMGLIRAFSNIGSYLPGSPIDRSMFEKLTNNLTFSDQKAREELGWSSSPALDALRFTY